MGIKQLDHVNLRTANLARMTAFYRDVLGFADGPRPPFGFGGAWLYCGDQPAVHLVEVEAQPDTRDPRLEHFAFQAEGMAEFLARLRSAGIAYEIRIVPEFEIRQVNIFDPDGNHLHVDFQPGDDADPTDAPGAAAHGT